MTSATSRITVVALLGLLSVFVAACEGFGDEANGPAAEPPEEPAPESANAEDSASTSDLNVYGYGELPGDVDLQERDCDAAVSLTFPSYAGVSELSWGSQQIVYGTVVEELGSRLLVAPGPAEDRPDDATIVTDFLIDTGESLRGDELDELTVRFTGGEVNGCVQEWDDMPDLSEGEDLALFLQNAPEQDGEAFYTTGGTQGLWYLAEDDSIRPAQDHQYEDWSGASLSDLTDQVRESLRDGEPPADLSGDQIVPLEEAELLD